MNKWAVWRHGGRNNDSWRLAYSSAAEAKARARYDALLSKMRQGGIELRTPFNELAREAWAPRLRTRW